MHMSDALVSPAVGGALWAATAGLVAWSARRVERDADDGRIPLMGVLGAFVFAAQMVNFSIPGTGSSGHLGGGLLLAALLGPWAGLLVMASVLLVQALFFADGGLLAFGCNVLNLGFATCCLAYPLVFRRLAGAAPTRARLVVAALVAAVVGLELGALGVVAETALSGVSSLRTGTFLALMLPIHLAIAVVEGLVTAAVLAFVWRARPELAPAAVAPARTPAAGRRVLIGFALAAALVGGALSLVASADPDGLEWAVARAAGRAEAEPPPGPVHAVIARAQALTSVLPGYAVRGAPEAAGTSAAGLLGAAITLALALGAGAGLRALARRGRGARGGAARPGVG